MEVKIVDIQQYEQEIIRGIIQETRINGARWRRTKVHHRTDILDVLESVIELGVSEDNIKKFLVTFEKRDSKGSKMKYSLRVEPLDLPAKDYFQLIRNNYDKVIEEFGRYMFADDLK